MAAVEPVSGEIGSLATRGLEEFRSELRTWLAAHHDALSLIDDVAGDFDARVEELRRVQRQLYDAGWLRFGWSSELGGLGGDARHRAIVYDELGQIGVALRGPCEHLEIIAAPLVRHWQALDAATFQAFLRGDELWCQGFSEPDAGSDLVSLKTRAVRDGDVYRVTGQKIWTSWAGNASKCLLLARTGSPDERHRGLSTFFVDLDSPGVDVRRVRQANGSDELGQVVFDDVEIPRECMVGGEGDGFAVALDVLACERSSFAWLRQAVLYTRADELAKRAGVSTDAELGHLLLDLLALRATSAQKVEQLADGMFPGPEAAVVKVLLTRAEQRLYDVAYQVFGSALALGSSTEMTAWQDEFLFSRAVSIYGGTKQVQLTTVARFVLGLPEAERA